MEYTYMTLFFILYYSSFYILPILYIYGLGLFYRDF